MFNENSLIPLFKKADEKILAGDLIGFYEAILQFWETVLEQTKEAKIPVLSGIKELRERKVISQAQEDAVQNAVRSTSPLQPKNERMILDAFFSVTNQIVSSESEEVKMMITHLRFGVTAYNDAKDVKKQGSSLNLAERMEIARTIRLFLIRQYILNKTKIPQRLKDEISGKPRFFEITHLIDLIAANEIPGLTKEDVSFILLQRAKFEKIQEMGNIAKLLRDKMGILEISNDFVKEFEEKVYDLNSLKNEESLNKAVIILENELIKCFDGLHQEIIKHKNGNSKEKLLALAEFYHDRSLNELGIRAAVKDKDIDAAQYWFALSYLCARDSEMMEEKANKINPETAKMNVIKTFLDKNKTKKDSTYSDSKPKELFNTRVKKSQELMDNKFLIKLAELELAKYKAYLMQVNAAKKNNPDVLDFASQHVKRTFNYYAWVYQYSLDPGVKLEVSHKLQQLKTEHPEVLNSKMSDLLADIGKEDDDVKKLAVVNVGPSPQMFPSATANPSQGVNEQAKPKLNEKYLERRATSMSLYFDSHSTVNLGISK